MALRDRATFRARALALAAAATFVACTSGQQAAGTAAALTSQAPTEAPTPAPTDTPAPPAVTRLEEVIALADGRDLRARCVGQGTPTVLLEVGGSNNITDWPEEFVQALGAGTTTCLYSRAGGRGSSPPATTPVSMAATTADAFELLDIARTRAGVAGPYVFVGWSLGGSVALADALARPDQAVGVAILDTDFPADFLKACQADGRTAADCQAEYQGDIDAKFMETQLAQAVHRLEMPAALVTAMRYPDCVDMPSATLSVNIAGATVTAADCAGLAAAIADKQIREWKRAFPAISQTRLDADHDGLILEAGPAISALVLAIVAQARSRP